MLKLKNIINYLYALNGEEWKNMFSQLLTKPWTEPPFEWKYSHDRRLTYLYLISPSQNSFNFFIASSLVFFVLSFHVFFFAMLNFYLIEISNVDWFRFISELASISDELLLPISRWKLRIGETRDWWINWVMLMNSLCEYRSALRDTSNNNYAAKVLFIFLLLFVFHHILFIAQGDEFCFHEKWCWIEFYLFIDFSKLSANLSINGLRMI